MSHHLNLILNLIIQPIKLFHFTRGYTAVQFEVCRWHKRTQIEDTTKGVLVKAEKEKKPRELG